MKLRLALFLGLIFASVAPAAVPEPVEAFYGEPTPFLNRLLQYPDFIAYFQRQRELARAAGGKPLLCYEFLVLDSKTRTRIGGFRFTGEPIANGRRFEVKGKIYAVEMYSTMKGRPAKGPRGEVQPLLQDSIAVWDEATARAENLPLLPLWKSHFKDPAREASAAFADGQLIEGFENYSDVTAEGGSSRRGPKYVATTPEFVNIFSGVPASPAVDARYGQVVTYKEATLNYPDFRLRMISESDADPANPQTTQIQTEIMIEGAKGRTTAVLVRELGANGFSVNLEGRMYLVETGRSTAGVEDSAEAFARSTPLKVGEFIVWSRAAAALKNPLLFRAWTGVMASGAGHASGVRTGPSVSRDYQPGKTAWPTLAQLDAMPVVSATAPIVFPGDLHGSGYGATATGIVFVNPDGSVDNALVTFVSDVRLEAAVVATMRQWRFVAPTIGGKPSSAMLRFSAWVIEGAPPQVVWRGE